METFDGGWYDPFRISRLEHFPTRLKRLTGMILGRGGVPLATAMRGIGERAERRHGAKEPGLRWANSAPGVRCAACPMNHIARRGAPAPGADLAHQTIQPGRKVL